MALQTYQDYLNNAENETNLKAFILKAIAQYKISDIYKWAVEGDNYSRQLNTTIMKYQKLLYTISGKAVPDNFTANHKCASNFFDRFITQENQYLLGNGISFNNKDTKEKLGGADFDIKIQKAGKSALSGAVSYLFYNLNIIDVFTALDFVPLYDEETGALKAGIRFWQINSEKPLRATLYTLDGYTEYIKKNKELVKLKDTTPYILTIKESKADGLQIVDGRNYETFPIVPLYGNPYKQSELVGIKSGIDCFDLIKSSFANDLDDASAIYWTLENCGGMDDIDLVKFIERMKTVRAAVVDGGDGSKAEAHTIDVPYQSREVYLTRLENDLYNDAMALNTHNISSGAITATAIRASYEPLNNKTDQYEYCVTEAILGILKLAGIEDYPIYKRSRLINEAEETATILSAAEYLDKETILRHLPFLSQEEVTNLLLKDVVK